jgi:hypothetical protein
MNVRKSTVAQKAVSLTLLFAFAIFSVAPLPAQTEIPKKIFGNFNKPRLLEEIFNQQPDADQPAVKNLEPPIYDDANVIYLNAEPLNVTSERARALRRAAPDFSGKTAASRKVRRRDSARLVRRFVEQRF